MSDRLINIDSDIDPSLLRGVTQSRISRRRFLKYAGLGAGAAGLSSILAACDISGTAPKEADTGFDVKGFWQKQQKAGILDFANWPYYIDRVQGGAHPSLDKFTQDTGIKVNYYPVIQDNAAFFAKLRPTLEAGQSTGYDVIIADNLTVPKYLRFGWATALDHDLTPNFNKNATDLAKDPPYDPDNEHTMPWQSGFTGIGYDPEKIGHELTSLDEIFDPKYAGKVGMMSDLNELGSVALLNLGIEPVSSTPDDWRKAADLLMKQRDDGIVRQYYDASYIRALEDGDVWISQAWSGDIFQANLLGYPNLKFAVPEQGVMIWTDTMLIPKGAEHPLDAITYMDYVYRPDIAALIADWVWYVSPVEGVADYILDKDKFESILGELPAFYDPTPGSSPLVIPDAKMKAAAQEYFVFETSEELDTWNGIFEPIITL